jgi:large subunit ribosomal protein L25
MEEIKLDVQVRKELGQQKVRRVRAEDGVPAIVYGLQQSPTPVKVDRRSYEKVMRSHQGQSVIFHLNVLEGEKKFKDYSVILKEEQHHPVSDRLLHIDFQRISLKQEITVKVPVVSVGDAAGVKDGGALDHHLWELEVICLPMDIPDRISVDISKLKIGDVIHVRELALPKGVRTKHEPESIVFSVLAPMKEEVLPVEGAPTEPELIKKEKKEVAGAEGEKAEAKKPEAKKEEKTK